MTVAEVEARRADLCASYQAAVIDALAGRVRRVLAREGGGLRSLGLSGGVANNRLLRAALEAEARRGGIPFLAAESRHTGDNAGMIAFAAAVDPAGAVRGDPCRLLIEPNAPLAP
jgi:N6-L-threonylcarbamoyladenine synthase